MIGADCTGPRDWALYREERIVERNRKAVPGSASVATVRNELLHYLAPPGHEGPFYDPAATALVERFEAALRRDWEDIERCNIEARAVAAVRNALQSISDGRLL